MAQSADGFRALSVMGLGFAGVTPNGWKRPVNIDRRTLNWVFGEPDDGQKAHRITALLYHSRVIGRIVVRPDRRGHGVGAALLRAMEERGLQRGVLWFCGIAVSEDSARFFRYNGYDVHGMETEGKPCSCSIPIWPSRSTSPAARDSTSASATKSTSARRSSGHNVSPVTKIGVLGVLGVLGVAVSREPGPLHVCASAENAPS